MPKLNNKLNINFVHLSVEVVLFLYISATAVYFKLNDKKIKQNINTMSEELENCKNHIQRQEKIIDNLIKNMKTLSEHNNHLQAQKTSYQSQQIPPTPPPTPPPPTPPLTPPPTPQKINTRNIQIAITHKKEPVNNGGGCFIEEIDENQRSDEDLDKELLEELNELDID